MPVECQADSADQEGQAGQGGIQANLIISIDLFWDWIRFSLCKHPEIAADIKDYDCTRLNGFKLIQVLLDALPHIFEKI